MRGALLEAVSHARGEDSWIFRSPAKAVSHVRGEDKGGDSPDALEVAASHVCGEDPCEHGLFPTMTGSRFDDRCLA